MSDRPASPLHIPPHFEPTRQKLGFEFDPPHMAGALLLRVTASQGKNTTVRVAPDGVTVTTPGVIRKAAGSTANHYPIDRIIDVRRATSSGVCLTLREPDGSWRRVLLPLLNETQKHGPSDLLQLATPWLAGEFARILGRPPLVDSYVAIPNWVDQSVEEAGRHGQLVYGAPAAPLDQAESPPPVITMGDATHPGERIEIPARPIPHRNIAAVAALCAIAWTCCVGVCAGIIGIEQAYILAAIFGLAAGLVIVLHAIDEVLSARQHITITGDAESIDIDVSRGLRRRRWRLTRGDTSAVYITPGRRWRRVVRCRPDAKDQTLIRGVDPAVARTVTALIERRLGLEPTEGPPTPTAMPTEVAPLSPVSPPPDPAPAGWELKPEIDGPGTWTITRPPAGIAEKLRTGGCFLGILAVTAMAASLFPGRGPVPGVVGLLAGGFGLLMLVGRLERALGSATVRYDGAAIHLARRSLFGRVRQRVELWSIERVDLALGAVTASRHLSANVQLRVRTGRVHSAIGSVDERHARWLARKLAHTLNMAEEVPSPDPTLFPPQ